MENNNYTENEVVEAICEENVCQEKKPKKRLKKWQKALIVLSSIVLAFFCGCVYMGSNRCFYIR